MRYGVVVFVVAAVMTSAVLTTRPAGAVKPFMEQFKAMYVKPKSKDRTMLIFNAAVEKKSCTICHGPKSKKTFNAYGEQVKKYLSKRDKENPSKIKTGLAKASKMKSVPDDSSSPTFGERLRAGKLPVGEIHVKGSESGV
jgi:hypothetical protein